MLGQPSSIKAVSDPLMTPNNKVGIHISDIGDVQEARELVNSNGGEWGYVTLVIRENNRDLEVWQEFFDELRKQKLIPLVRIAIYGEGANWVKPTEEDVQGWVNFLNGLNWVTKNRYVILFNEPNHAKEWGGEIDPAEYARVVEKFAIELKAASDDFYILPAGMDDAASDTTITMNSARYFKEMYQENPRIFSIFDGWTSHAYPNPNFSGSPQATGPGSIRGFEAELRLVKQFGFDETKPVFITETGWAHSDGVEEDRQFLTPDEVADNMVYAYEKVWSHPQVAAVTPFILDYPQLPFDHFSWKQASSQTYLPQYDAVKALKKIKGVPDQGHNSAYQRNYLPKELAADKGYRFMVEFKNTGQSIWESEEFKLGVMTNIPEVEVKIDTLSTTSPGEIASTFVTLKVPQIEGEYMLDFQIMKGETYIGEKAISEIIVSKNEGVMTKIKLWIQQLRYPEQFIVAFTYPMYWKKRSRYEV
jgi:hypothetical protein